MKLYFLFLIHINHLDFIFKVFLDRQLPFQENFIKLNFLFYFNLVLNVKLLNNQILVMHFILLLLSSNYFRLNLDHKYCIYLFQNLELFLKMIKLNFPFALFTNNYLHN